MEDSKIYINEIFGPTIQGEGKYAGHRVGFIRTSGCNLRCAWTRPDGKQNLCDTYFTSWTPEGQHKTLDEIVQKVNEMKVQNIVISGGEPYIQKQLPILIDILKSQKYHITIETNGTIYQDTKADFLSISPKLFSSTPIGQPEEQMHRKNRVQPLALRNLIDKHDYQLKFVISSPKDLEEIRMWQRTLHIPDNKIWLMPEGISKEDLEKTALETAELAIKYGFNYSDRTHIRLWNTKRGV